MKHLYRKIALLVLLSGQSIIFSQDIKFNSVPQNKVPLFSGVTGYPANGISDIADIDGDGDLDIIISGVLYINDGNGGYNQVTNTPFKTVEYATCNFADVDNDGDPDLFISGVDGNTGSAKLYINNNGVYILSTDSIFERFWAGAVAFSDIDNDGDLDIMTTGQQIGIPTIANMYVNDGNGVFSKKENTPFAKNGFGSVEFADVDNDGDQDLFLAGSTNNDDDGYVANLYINDGVGNFEQKIIGVPFEGVRYCDIKCADMDGNNTIDVFITGATEGRESISNLYLNDGNGNFREDINNTFGGGYSSVINLSDIDNNNTIDITITRIQDNSYKPRTYLNDGFGNFSISENTTFSAGDDIASFDYNGDNKIDFFFSEIRVGSYIYTNDGDNSFTKISAEGTPFNRITNGGIEHFDIEGDGDQDIIITGNSSGGGKSHTAILYVNDGTGNFSVKYDTNLIGVSFSDVAVSDIDGDDDVDLLIAGASYDPVEDTYYARTDLYINNGKGDFFLVQNSPFIGVANSHIEFVDINKDDFDDVFIAGNDSNGNWIAKTYLNGTYGNFSEIANPNFIPTGYLKAEFFDIDNDSDNDAVVIAPRSKTKILLNNGSGVFTEKSNENLLEFGSWEPIITSGDINNDGNIDLFLSGHIKDGTIVSEIYINDGIGNFTKKNSRIEGAYSGTADFSDLDNDGTLDLLITGYGNEGRLSKIYSNNGNGDFLDTNINNLDAVTYSDVSIADVDSDEKKDLVITGWAEEGAISKLYLNLSISCNYIDKTITNSNNILSSNAIGVEYQWINVDSNTPIEGETNKEFELKENGTFAVKLSDSNCSVISDSYIANTLSLDSSKNGIMYNVYPIPAKNILNIKRNEGSEIKILIYDILGRCIYDEKTSKKDIKLDIEKYSRGIYHLKIIDSGKSITKKILID